VKRRGFLQSLLTLVAGKGFHQPKAADAIKLTNPPSIQFITKDQIGSLSSASISAGSIVVYEYTGRPIGKLPLF
jgi:hypothetical protein